MRLEDKLGWIAMKYRGQHKPGDREEAIREYAWVVHELIESGIWAEFPGPEDQLPDEHMPEAFFAYWGFDWVKNSEQKQTDQLKPPGATPSKSVDLSFAYDYNPEVYGQLLGLFARNDAMNRRLGDEDQPKHMNMQVSANERNILVRLVRKEIDDLELCIVHGGDDSGSSLRFTVLGLQELLKKLESK